MCRKTLYSAWIVAVVALACCLWSNVRLNATTVDCYKNGPIVDDPPENPLKPCGHCQEKYWEPETLEYAKCDTSPNPAGQQCNESSNVDGVICESNTDNCSGMLRRYTTSDCSGDPVPGFEEECERMVDEAWWWDDGEEPVCPL